MVVPIQVVGSAADKELVMTWSGADSRDRQNLTADVLRLLGRRVDLGRSGTCEKGASSMFLDLVCLLIRCPFSLP